MTFFFCNLQAMKLIPKEWSIGVVSQFLSGSVRLSLHKSRNTKILRSLARGENLKASLYCISTLFSKQNCYKSEFFEQVS